MKKLALLGGILSLSIAGSTLAQGVLPSVSSLLENASWGYDASRQIALTTISPEKLTLESPRLKDINSDDATLYYLFYATGNIHQLLNSATGNILQAWENYPPKKVIELRSAETTATGVTISLELADGLTANDSYCALVVPVDKDNEPGNASQQFCFNLGKKKFSLEYDPALFGNITTTPTTSALEGARPVAGTTSDALEHNAGRSDMNLANITHTITGDTITLIWTKVGSAQDIDLYVFAPGANGFSKVATVKMSNERYDYKFAKDGEHIFRFIPSD